MARLGIIALLLVCITITGVYAVWTYAGTNDIADAFAEAKVTIADVELAGANGIYKIESNLVLTIDQANDDHEAELIFGSNNGQEIYLKVTFTPAANAPQSIKDNAVLSELYFGTTLPMTYRIDADGNYVAEGGTEVSIFTFKNPGNNKLDNTFTWTKEADGSFTYTMDEAALKDMIKLSQTFVLDTKAEHDAFRAALTGNIVARVTDGIIN
jgi:hypothetical protein